MERGKFTRAFNLEAVKLIQERGVTVAQAARDLGVQGSVLRRWVQECAADSQADLNTIALRLNQRPRKTLGFQTPAAILEAAVASTA